MKHLFTSKGKILRQKGTVLIVALFVMVLLEVTIVALVLYHRIEIRSAGNYFASQKAMQLALAGEGWAQSKIVAFYKNSKFLDEVELRFPIDGGFVNTTVLDVQGRFNVNNLVDDTQFAGFQSMLKALIPNKPELANQIIQLVQNGKSQLNATYTNGDIILPITSITQLRSLKGMTAKAFNSLLPHCFALPNISPLNINTATEFEMMSLSPKITKDLAKSIIGIRQNQNGFKAVAAFTQLPQLEEIEIDSDRITVLSQFYLSSVVVHYETADLTLYSLIRVMKVGNRFITMVYWRSFGTI